MLVRSGKPEDEKEAAAAQRNVRKERLEEPDERE